MAPSSSKPELSEAGCGQILVNPPRRTLFLFPDFYLEGPQQSGPRRRTQGLVVWGPLWEADDGHRPWPSRSLITLGIGRSGLRRRSWSRGRFSRSRPQSTGACRGRGNRRRHEIQFVFHIRALSAHFLANLGLIELWVGNGRFSYPAGQTQAMAGERLVRPVRACALPTACFRRCDAPCALCRAWRSNAVAVSVRGTPSELGVRIVAFARQVMEQYSL